jgi:hypothetical protein
MQYHIQTLVKHLFDKDSFEQVTAQELKQFTDDYPYAAVGQFLYARKLKDSGSYNHYEQSETSSLYFSNPLWLRYILDKKEEAPALPERRNEQVQQPGFRILVQKSGALSETDVPAEIEGPETTAVASGIEEDPDGFREEAMVAEETSPSYKEETIAEADITPSTQTVEEVQTEHKQTEATPVEPEVASAVAIAETSQLAEESKTEAAVNAVSITEEALTAPAAVAETTGPEAEQPVNAETTETPVAEEATTPPAAAEENIQPSAAVAVEEPVAPQPAEEVTAGTPPAEAETPAVTGESTGVTETPVREEEKVQQPAHEQAAPAQPVVFTPASQEAKTAVDLGEPIFESYHTIDYFASQGIKLQQEDFKDRLGKQLKSFTDWLRSMKRIGPIETSTSLDEITNQSIQRIAEHSVEEKEVLTEAMAEVWVKQGHTDKAIRVYEKLSLLNPSKSPYFAGRIEQLKAL